MAGRQGRGGCWTCRLRRKRCDGARPVCRGCTALEITCHGGETRPDWMDGAARQREMAHRIKTRIKDGASARCERRAGTSACSQTAFIVTSQQDYVSEQGEPSRPRHPGGSRAQPASEDGLSSAMPSGAQMKECDVAVAFPDDASSPSSLSSSTKTSDGAVTSPTARSVLDLPHKLTSDIAGSLAAFPSLGRAWELDFIQIYLNYVFPFLFPFYRHPLVGTSRAWLLSFLRQNSAVFHSVLSLSSFFFTVGLDDIFPSERGPCKSMIWGQVVKQSNMSFEMIQKDLVEINKPGAQAGLLEKAHIMETIVQLLMFELFVGRSGNWNTHLAPALTLFEDIFEETYRSFPAKPGLHIPAVDSAAQMHTFAWPICVAGCLAEGDAQEQEFGAIITGTGDLLLLSAVRESGRIMKAVWRSRQGLDGETWDMTACFRVLGTPALLV